MAKMEQEDRLPPWLPENGPYPRRLLGSFLVDLDGDIIVLEATDGHEMYWERETSPKLAVSHLADTEQKDTLETAGTTRRRTRTNGPWLDELTR